MTTIQIVYAIIIFVVVTGGAMAILLPLAPSRSQRRLESAVADDAAHGADGSFAGWGSAVRRLATPFARLSLPSQGWESSPLRVKFANAGFRGEGPVLFFFGAKTLLALVLPALAYLFVNVLAIKLSLNLLLVMLLSLAAIGYYLPNGVLDRLILRRQREIFENFPDAADLMLVCVESGLGLDAALARVTDEIRLKSIPLAEELHLVGLELRAGNSRENALRNLALRTGVEEVNTFVTMLVQADRFGTSIGDSLRVFADELRTKRQQRAEEIATKIPIKLLFPLVFFIFPSMLLVMLGPAFIQIYRVLLPAMAGRS